MKTNNNSDELQNTITLLRDIQNNSIDKLYRAIDGFIFQDVDYDKIIGFMPKWICDAGNSPEERWSKVDYERSKSKAKHPIFGRIIYYYDLWAKVATVQDRLSAVIYFIEQLYKNVPCVASHTEKDYTSRRRQMGDSETQVHILINSVFVVMASAFDVISKIATEQYIYDKYDFSNYRGMKSSNILFRSTLPNIDKSLKDSNMLFSDPKVIHTICTFRNEYVHNGPWDLRTCVYYTYIDDTPSDVIVYSPDIDENGNFVKSGSRNKFYSQANRINIELPKMIREASQIIKDTLDRISDLYKKNTQSAINSQYTEECIDAIKKYWKEEAKEIASKNNIKNSLAQKGG